VINENQNNTHSQELTNRQRIAHNELDLWGTQNKQIISRLFCFHGITGKANYILGRQLVYDDNGNTVCASCCQQDM
jgi:hypothetical protein